jgi:hypothetical protein
MCVAELAINFLLIERLGDFSQEKEISSAGLEYTVPSFLQRGQSIG